MRRCEDCRTEYEDSLYSCPNCGSDLSRPINQEKTTTVESSSEDPAHLKYMQSIAEATENETKSRKTLLVIAAALGVVIVIIVAMVAGYLNDPQRDIDKAAKEQYEIAVEYIENSNYEAGLKALDQVDVSWSDYDKVEKQRVKAVKGQLKLKLETYNAENNYEAIINLINNNIDNIEDDDEIKTTYNNSVQNYRTFVIEEAEKYIVAKDYENATKLLTKASTLLGGDETIDSKLFEVNKAQALISIKDFDSKKDYESAIKYIRNNLDSLNNDAEIKAELSRFEGLYRDKIVKDAETAYKKDGYASALSIINKGLNLLPDDAKLLFEKSAYEECVPKSLLDINFYQKTLSMETLNSVTDITGKTFSSAIKGKYQYYHFDEFSQRTYELNGKYNILTAKGIVIDEFKGYDSDWKGTIKIYGDGILLYQKSYNSDTKPFNIQVDITGVSDLRIEMSCGYLEPCICEVFLQKVR